MACIYRPTYTRTDPKTGKKVVRKLKKWYGKYAGPDGRERRVPLSTNRAAAQIMLADLVKAAEMGRAVADPYAAHRKRPLSEHLDEWEAELINKGSAAKYVRMKANRCRRLVAGCGFETIADLSASKVAAWLGKLREKGIELTFSRGTRAVKPGQQTSNHYLGAVKEFARWLVNDGRTDTLPLARLSGGNVDTDRRHPRRALPDAELRQLLGALPDRPPVRRLTGPDRRMLYLCALYTGLRAQELASLTPESFDLGEAPTVTVLPGYSKARRLDVVPLHPGLLAELRPWLAGRPPGERLWPGNWAKGFEAGVILKADLEAAGVPYRTADGYADFHALRHTYITRIVKSGAQPKEAQALSRHRDIRLTLERYAHLGLLEAAAALLRMPEIPAGKRRESA